MSFSAGKDQSHGPRWSGLNNEKDAGDYSGGCMGCSRHLNKGSFLERADFNGPSLERASNMRT